MTKAEARAHFGLKDSDSIIRENVLTMLRNAEDRLKVWTLPNFRKVEIMKDIEAYMALLD